MLGRVDVIGEQFGEPLLGQPVELLVLPERVVGIEADGGEGGGHGARWIAEPISKKHRPVVCVQHDALEHLAITSHYWAEAEQRNEGPYDEVCCRHRDGNYWRS